MRADLWVDGFCFQNRQLSPGGWAVVMKNEPYDEEISGSSKNTTWYQMELMAVLRGIKLAKSCHEELTNLVIHSDHEDSIRYLSDQYDFSSEKAKGIHLYLQEIEWALGNVILEFQITDEHDSRNQRVSRLSKQEAEKLLETAL